MSILVKNILRFVLLILVQFFVLDKVHLHYMVTPYIYYLFVLWMPFNTSRSWQMILAFLLGFTLDSFRHSPGFHAAACVLIAYLRPFLINILIPQEGAEANYEEPSARSLGGFVRYMIYTGLLTLVHHGWLFLLEAWNFANFWYFVVKTLLSTAISLLLILIAEMLFARKQKFRTNTM
ncbi:MAG TPA: rod shape-determining protein MreD [Ferruginibacter sp.]|nr:rod shape-determining protein MreD [Ferruginibacter sp.]HMP19540.1 rod shape-determining protein MreD [Ferruginibacter sp.]